MKNEIQVLGKSETIIELEKRIDELEKQVNDLRIKLMEAQDEAHERFSEASVLRAKLVQIHSLAMI
jgi:regulator of replication initiation timing